MQTVTVVTSTRADYGLLRPVLQKLAAQNEVAVRLLVTGSHLLPELGNTIEEIEKDTDIAALIDEKMDILSQPVPQGRQGTAQRVALALQKGLAYFTKTMPDVVLVLGDRYEIFAIAQAAALLDIPVAHISGGDVTFGADDDWMRHCITKMAKLHFPSCEAYRQRVLRMGEDPGKVFNVGGLGDENISSMQLMEREELEKSLNLSLQGRPYALVTFHPETATGIPAAKQADIFLQAVERVSQLFYIFTMANADAGGEEMNQKMRQFCQTHTNAALFSSLGVLRYLSAMRYAAVVLGNSSSGVVETPSFGVPAVNVGSRQTGREICANVINCDLEADKIEAAISAAMQPQFAVKAAATQSPYNGGDTSGKIVSILLRFMRGQLLTGPKTFYDGEGKV